MQNCAKIEHSCCISINLNVKFQYFFFLCKIIDTSVRDNTETFFFVFTKKFGTAARFFFV